VNNASHQKSIEVRKGAVRPDFNWNRVPTAIHVAEGPFRFFRSTNFKSEVPETKATLSAHLSVRVYRAPRCEPRSDMLVPRLSKRMTRQNEPRRRKSALWLGDCQIASSGPA
jgi:hypothetical protein